MYGLGQKCDEMPSWQSALYGVGVAISRKRGLLILYSHTGHLAIIIGNAGVVYAKNGKEQKTHDIAWPLN